MNELYISIKRLEVAMTLGYMPCRNKRCFNPVKMSGSQVCKDCHCRLSLCDESSAGGLSLWVT